MQALMNQITPQNRLIFDNFVALQSIENELSCALYSHHAP